MKTLILGMGNPILSDDGVGIFVTRKLGERIEGVDVITTALVGLDVLDILAGYDRVFLIDALTTQKNQIGELKKLGEDEGTLHLFSSHGLNFFELLQLGKDMGQKMPEVGGIYGIEIGDTVSFGEELSTELRERVQSIVDAIAEDIKFSLQDPCRLSSAGGT